VLFGEDGADQLRGGDGDDTIDGGRQADRIYGDAGDDVLIGGRTGDVFGFRDGFGHDVITDFNADEDIVQFAKSAFRNFARVDAAMVQVGGDVVITASNGDSITLVHVAVADLSTADFAFVA
jgi:Ca2+-binding RTX toxin-like protein